MGAEYWLVKPNKKETFYLGKHVEPIDGICNASFVANYIEYDCFQDFFLAVIESNDGFLDGDYTYNQVKEFAHTLYKWCDDKVYLSSDYSQDVELWKDYKETGSICDFLEKHSNVFEVAQYFAPELTPQEIDEKLEKLL